MGYINNKGLIEIILILFLLLMLSITAPAQELPLFTIMTEEWKPFNFSDDGTLKGISVEIMDLMLRRSGSSQRATDIDMYPWARAYKTVLENKNTVLFTMVRTEAREELFKWVGPIQVINFNEYGLRSRNLKINSIADLKQYSFVTMKDDASEEILIKKAQLTEENFYRANSNRHVAQLMDSGRYDLILTSDIIAESLAGYIGKNPDIFKPLMMLDSQPLYFAFHRETPDSVINLFQNKLNELKEEGIVDEIKSRYSAK